jgi:hypothetical protein
MSSPNPWTLSAFDARSRDLETPVRDTLTAFASDGALHARFLNTLSLMEHIGSRKIMASQSVPGHDTLKHLAEEARHAFFFKRAAEKEAGEALDYSPRHTIAGAEARMYMGRLDAFIAATLQAADARAYLYMSLIVELRAIWTYRLYQDALLAAGAPLSLKSVLAEEELHLDEMWDQLETLDSERDSHVAAFAAFEDGRFRTLWRALSQAAPQIVARGAA